jgi:hypothetical protein
LDSRPQAEAPQAWGITTRNAAFPLEVSANGRYLVDQQGVPFLVQGDTPWSLTHNLTFSEAVTYLDDRRARGFNSLIISAPDAYGPDGSHQYPPDRSGNDPFLENDLAKPDEAYWAHVDRVLEKSEQSGFLVLFFPAYLGCCEDGYLQLLRDNGVAKARAYGRWLGARYRERTNLIWVHGGDRVPDDAIEEVRAVRDGIGEEDPGKLHTVHWAPETDPWIPFGEDWIDLYTAYTYGPVAARVAMLRDHPPVKPVILIETHYEDDFGKKAAADVRKYPYRAVFSGAAGHFFGNRPLWFCGVDWRKALNSPGSHYLTVAMGFFRSRSWNRLEPDSACQLIPDSSGSRLTDQGIQAAISETGEYAVAYLPEGEPVTVNLTALPADRLQLWWFDPRSGLSVNGGTCASTSQLQLSPPSREDWVLVIDDESKGFSPPGRPGAVAGGQEP